MKIRNTVLMLTLLLSLSRVMFGQSDDIRLFGYFQNDFTHLTVNTPNQQAGLDEYTFLMQQMNIFMAKDFGPQLGSFVNIEFTNSFSSTKNIGGIKIEEAWLKYSPSSSLNIKAGLLVPRFNAMNEIKNRTVLLPYIYRPLVYETVFNSQFGCEDFVPQQAYLQVYGDVEIGEKFRFNYAAYTGNLSSDNLRQNDSLGILTAYDSTKFKMFGGRIGFEYDNLSFGVSGTYDRKNLWSYGIGFVPRMRFGAYLNYTVAGFELESEYIRVYHDLSAENKSNLNNYNSTHIGGPNGFNKYYFHVNILYNITNQLFAYAGYDYLETEDNLFSKGGLSQPAFGGGYKVNDSVVLKAEYTFQRSTTFAMKVDRSDYLLAASIYF